MKLAVWTYEGPPHVGAMRVATAMRGLHLVLHAPQGDTYADLLFTMIERRGARPPVTYTTFQARDLGGDTAELFRAACRAGHDRFRPEALLVGASCTAELIQDDPGGLARSLGLPVPVVALDLPAYSRRENFGTDETFLRLVRAFARPQRRSPAVTAPSAPPGPARRGRRGRGRPGPGHLAARRRGGTAQGSLLRARTGAAQHRALRRRPRHRRDRRRDPVRGEGPSCALTAPDLASRRPATGW